MLRVAFGAEPVTDSASAPVLRYQLRPGMELVYESKAKAEHRAGFMASSSQASLWVVGETPPKSWQIAVRFHMVQSGSYSNKPYGTTNLFVGRILLSDEGRISQPVPEYLGDLLPEFLVLLPRDTTKAEAGWTAELGPGDEARFRLLPRLAGKPDEWRIERTEHGVSREVAASTAKSTFHFDGRRGVVTRSATEETYRLDLDVTNTAAGELKSVSERPLDWVWQMGVEAEIAARAFSEMFTLSNEAERSGAARPVKAITKLLREARARVQLPVVAEYLDGELAALKEIDGAAEAEGKPKETLAGKPAPDWIAKGIDGLPHRFQDYRGKVVLMDFWYRGCSWCIKTMPQLKQVADYYRDKPVVLLGINTDDAVKDAKFVMDRLQLNYPVLLGKDLVEPYRVEGFPTLVVVDSTGKVVGQHSGYSPTLKEDLIRQVDELLKKK